MLINENELQTLCLSVNALDDLAAQVINQFNGISDPLVRYATARSLQAVIDQVVADTSKSAEYYCLQHNLGSDGKQFTHAGLSFSLQKVCDYNYAANDKDENGKPYGYGPALRAMEQAKKQYQIEKKLVDAIKGRIVLTHPKMAPTSVKTTVKFHGQNV